MARRKQAKRILLAIPAGTGERTLCRQTWESLQAQDWPHVLDTYILREDAPEESHTPNLCAKLNRARDVALSGDYDALWIVESDMIVPSHALQRMSRAGGDIVYGLYCSRRSEHHWLATEDTSGTLKGVVAGFANQTGAAEKLWGTVAETRGLGTGCTLIQRHVLEAFPFRHEPGDEDAHTYGAPDWYLAADAVKAGFKQMHDFGVVCGHIMRPDPLKVVWPIQDAPYHRIDDAAEDARSARRALTTASAGKYRALKAITVKSSNRLVRPGEYLDLDAGTALLLMQRNVIEPAMEDQEKGDGTNNRTD